MVDHATSHVDARLKHQGITVFSSTPLKLPKYSKITLITRDDAHSSTENLPIHNQKPRGYYNCQPLTLQPLQPPKPEPTGKPQPPQTYNFASPNLSSQPIITSLRTHIARQNRCLHDIDPISNLCRNLHTRYFTASLSPSRSRGS